MDYNRTHSGAQNGQSPSTSSVYSDQSEPKPMYARSGLSASSRPTSRTSYTPSYMSIPRKPTPTSFDHNAAATPTRSAPAAVEVPAEDPPGALLVLIAGAFMPAVLSHIEVLLSRQPFSTIAIAAISSQEVALKQLKMDCYALIGKLRKEMGVETYSHSKWEQSEFDDTVKQVTRNGGSIQGVLCCPELADLSEDIDVLELEEKLLHQSWKSSVAFLHSASKATIKPLLSRCKSSSNGVNGALARQPRGPFFIVANSTTHTSLSQIAKAASDALVLQVEAAATPKGLIVGYAEAMLIPEPQQEEDRYNDQSTPSLRTDDYITNGQDSAFAAGESPTKLYAMWALQDQLGNAD